MSYRRKEAKKRRAKAIFISADCWLKVFDLLPPRQLGLGISMISHRFNFYVDEHFKTRKWALKPMEIKRKRSYNDTKEMEITNYRGKPMQIPQKPLPKKVVGFRAISIEYIDNYVIAFLQRFCPLLAVCPINLNIQTDNDRITEFILHNIWPMLGKNLYGLGLSVSFFRRLRKFVPSLFTNLTLLRVVKLYSTDIFPEFPCDDSAAASDGQMVAKWLFTPLQEHDMPKVFKCHLNTDDVNWMSRTKAIKAAFASASSPVNFIVFVWLPSPFDDSVLLFDLTNEFTREQLALKRIDKCRHFLLVRCPIARDENKWTKWEKEADWRNDSQQNQIGIAIFGEKNIGDRLLGAIPGPSDQQK
ncbi:hypothetical protein niasHT_005742 [Heterodera trifolii]|uniref:F-box domain-containing protein n=1 Tax=Heterodera trifolii TaxID=157864 RepID=A0ABD2LYW0_9BILA